MIRFIEKYQGIAVWSLLVAIPVAIWAAMAPLGLRFENLSATAASLGQISGLLGMTMFSLNLILSGRFKFLDRIFYGLDRMYDFHHKMGAVAFSLLLFHPIFLTARYLKISLRSAALFLIPGSNPAVTYGIIALILMMVLIILTFYARIKYHHWKISHKLMTAVFILALIHIFLIGSDISRNSVLKWYILTLAFLGLSIGLYRAFIRKYANNDHAYRITEIEELNDEIAAISAEPLGEAIRFEPGQYAFFRFKSRGVNSESHPFSITYSPDGKGIRLVTKSLGDFTENLKYLRPGDLIYLEGPFGRFTQSSARHHRQIWIAGGIGITPFLAMAEKLKNRSDYSIDLYYCAANKSEAVLLDEIQKIASANHNFRVIAWYSQEKGRINGRKIHDQSDGLETKSIFICGPSGFMDDLKSQLIRLGVSQENIHLEKFSL